MEFGCTGTERTVHKAAQMWRVVPNRAHHFVPVLQISDAIAVIYIYKSS